MLNTVSERARPARDFAPGRARHVLNTVSGRARPVRDFAPGRARHALSVPPGGRSIR
ncbi:hypothetical protein GTY66_12005 [Streptomyces sp. SID8356]|uniref:hypothetical protein n=1 Tax=unclassified Streptomyces TaxID=2593676 RepID=UPI00131A12A9|nr:MULTISPECIES: hypothetical protein [unclassified Streptomyces]MYT36765.1 hypothetical protein [Streptomyces sp. SID8356]